MANDGSSSKRLKTTRSTATTTAQGPQRRLQGSAKPRNQAAKVTFCLLNDSLNSVLKGSWPTADVLEVMLA
jgi:hypothetical protein